MAIRTWRRVPETVEPGSTWDLDSPAPWGWDVESEHRYGYETTWAGRVLATYERNGRDDSDFYAIVWDDEAGRPRDVEYATTRAWTYGNGAVADATEEVQEKYRAWCAARQAEAYAAAEAEEALVPRAGKTVTVSRGGTSKGVAYAAGDTGAVFWYGVDKYRSNRWITRYRVGVALPQGRVFVPAERVQVAETVTV